MLKLGCGARSPYRKKKTKVVKILTKNKEIQFSINLIIVAFKSGVTNLVISTMHEEFI